MDTKPSRPASVWIAQIILALLSLLFLVVAGLFLFQVNQARVSVILTTAIYVGFSAAFAIAFWGLATRRVFGRWFSVFLLGIFLPLSIYSLFRDPNVIGTTAGYNIGYISGYLLIPALLFWLSIVLAKSNYVNRFFEKPE